MAVICRRGDPHHRADRLDPIRVSVIVYESDGHLPRRSSSAWAKYAHAFRKISLVRFSSRFSRSISFRRCRASVVSPARWPRSRSAWRTHLAQGLGRAAELTGDRANRRPLEDEPALSPGQKQAFAERFIDVVAGRAAVDPFAREFGAGLSASTTASEHDLITNTARVIRITHGFWATQRDVLERCVRIMARGTAQFQQHANHRRGTEETLVSRRRRPWTLSWRKRPAT